MKTRIIMYYRTFTAQLPVETKIAVISSLKKYTNIKCDPIYYHLNCCDEFYVDLKDSGEVLAELEFSDFGVKLMNRPAKGFKIDIDSINSNWQAELFESFGMKYSKKLEETSDTGSTIEL